MIKVKVLWYLRSVMNPAVMDQQDPVGCGMFNLGLSQPNLAQEPLEIIAWPTFANFLPAPSLYFLYIDKTNFFFLTLLFDATTHRIEDFLPF